MAMASRLIDPSGGGGPPRRSLLLRPGKRRTGPRLRLIPEEEAALIYGVGYDDLGYPVEFSKGLIVGDWHNREERRIADMLELHFREQGRIADVSVEWPVIWHELPEEEYPLSPDVMVNFGLEMLPPDQRDGPGRARDESYRVWEHESRRPDWVLEISSKSTWRNDISRKPRGKLTKYESLGVPEYVVVDLRGRWLKPPLRMWKRQEGRLVEQAPDAEGRFRSEVLDLEIGLKDCHLVFYRRDGTMLPALGEALEAERQRAEAERQRAEEAEEELERLRGELERLRASRTP